MRLVDVRCDAIRTKGPRRGQRCNYLLHRIWPGTVGYEETKCPRCNAVKTWAWGNPLDALAGSTYA